MYAFHLGQIIPTLLGQVGHDGRHGNAARTTIRDEPSEIDHTQTRSPRHNTIYQTIGSEMVLLGMVIGKCEMPSTDILQENDHAVLIVKRQFVAYNLR